MTLLTAAGMTPRRGLQATCIGMLLMAASADLLAGASEQARRMHDRIAGVPPSPAVLDAMVDDIDGGNPLAAARRALEHTAFYDVTLKNLVAPWTNEAQSVFVPLNDYTATVIGLVRDDADFRTVLYDDVLYVGSPALGLPAYSISNNNHYEALENGGYSLKNELVRVAQSSRTGLPPEATAGVMTTRAAARAYFIAGTNRAMFRFTLMNHLCHDLEQVNDTSRPADRIRQDVSRSPGGDSRIFLNSCVGCHAGMDPLTQAFAYYDWDYDAASDPEGDNGRIAYNQPGQLDPETGTRVKAKYHLNAGTFEYGYVTPDDTWDNYWRVGRNALLGWDPALPGSGQGASSMGQELAHSDAFAQCHVQQVFQTVCLREPVDSQDRAQIDAMVASFQTGGYRLKDVFAESAVYCRGQ